MKIALINGSPKLKDSASQFILDAINSLLNAGDETTFYHLRSPSLTGEDIDQLQENDVLLFAFPLYVDGIPAHLLSCLNQLEAPLAASSNKMVVYAVVNCGFYEGHQARWAIEMMENWCSKAEQTWGQGVGVGAGAMLPSLTNVPLGYGPLKNLGKVLQQLANNVSRQATGDSAYIVPNFPKLAYKLAGEMSMRRSIKANGLNPKEIHLRK